MSGESTSAKREWRQPKCPICGRFATKEIQADGETSWRMTCMSGNPIDGWSHA